MFFQKKPQATSRRTLKLWVARCKAAAAMTMALILLICGLWLWFSTTWTENLAQYFAAAGQELGFEVKNIVIVNHIHVTPQEIQNMVRLKKGMPILAVDLESLRQSLMTIPWIKEAQVTRQLPKTIVMTLEERKPLARWEQEGTIAMVDEEGVILGAAKAKNAQDLPLVKGDHAPLHTQDLLRLLKSEPVIEAQFSAATWVGDRRWTLHLKNGMNILLPAQDEGLALARLARAAQELGILSKNIARIDLRLPDRMVLMPLATPENGKENI